MVSVAIGLGCAMYFCGVDDGGFCRVKGGQSDVLLDDQALLASKSHVDPNSRTSLSDRFAETSEHLCAKQRINALEKKQLEKKTIESFVGSLADEIGIPFRLVEYFELVDWTGQIIRSERISAAQLIMHCRRC